MGILGIFFFAIGAYGLLSGKVMAGLLALAWCIFILGAAEHIERNSARL